MQEDNDNAIASNTSKVFMEIPILMATSGNAELKPPRGTISVSNHHKTGSANTYRGGSGPSWAGGQRKKSPTKTRQTGCKIRFGGFD